MIRMFKSKDYVEAIEFKDFTSIQAIVQLTGMEATIKLSNVGALQSVTLRKAENVVVAIPGQFVYKNNSGTIGVCDYKYLAENYEEITETAE